VDRCRGLAQKVMCKVSDPVAQHIHRKNEEHVSGQFCGQLNWSPGRQVRFANPQSMQQALTIALLVTEAEKQERASEIFFEDC